MRPEIQVRDTGYLTPDSVPSALSRRAFFIPTDPMWYGLFMGAIAPLLNEEAWRKFGTLTPEECAAVWQEIFFSDAPCGCELPDGAGSVLRINSTTGHIQEISPDTGEWVDPSGTYAVPAIAPREDGATPEDKRCLAAANAAHVYELLYESITDSIAGGLEASAAFEAFITVFIAQVGWAFAPIATALVVFFMAVFAVVYVLVETFGTDVWDSTFTDTLKCILFNCSSIDGENIVTFDYECVTTRLAQTQDGFSVDQARLITQMSFILQCTGGVDGLSQAATTTAIVTADCTGCNPCVTYDFTVNDGGWAGLGGTAYSAGIGWIGHYQATNSQDWAYIALTIPTQRVLSLEMTFCIDGGSSITWSATVYGLLGGSPQAVHQLDHPAGCPVGWSGSMEYGAGGELDELRLNVNSGETPSQNVIIKSATVCYV